MTILDILRGLRPIHRNKKWLSSSASISHKILYYPAVTASYIRFMTGQRRIKYLGHRFDYDNIATPLNIMPYPDDICSDLLGRMLIRPRRILYIGGNLGQFSVTLSYFLKKPNIDIFEPNPAVYSLLKNNIGRVNKNAKVYNYALSPDGNRGKKINFYYEPGRSATGSFIRNNASNDRSKLSKIEVQAINSPSKLTGIKEYDLIKIDVEGFEIDVVKSLKGIRTKYLFIEVSSANRNRRYNDSELLLEIRKIFGDYIIEYMTGYKGTELIYEVLLKFIKNKSQDKKSGD